MDHPVTCSKWWGPIAEAALEAEGLPYDSWNMEMLEREIGSDNLNMSRII